MAFLLRLRTIHTLETSSPSLLRHHRRLCSTSTSLAASDHPNSNLPSPALLRELREAIKQLSASDYVVDSKTPTYTTYRFVLPSNPEQSHHQNALPSSASFDAVSPTKLDAKFEQLKASALSLRRRQATDRERLWELKRSRVSFRDEIVVRNIAKHVRMVEELKGRRRGALLPEKREMLVDEINGLIDELQKLMDMMVEAVDLLRVLMDSRLGSLEEIIKNLSEMKNDLQQEVWDELNEGLMKGRDAEEKEATFLAVEIRQQLDFLIPVAENLYKLGHTYM